MTKGQRTIAALLAAVVVLLGLDIASRMTPTAQAHPTLGTSPPVRVVGMALEVNSERAWRMWSDGVFETRRWTGAGHGRCWSPFVGNDWITVEECP